MAYSRPGLHLVRSSLNPAGAAPTSAEAPNAALQADDMGGRGSFQSTAKHFIIINDVSSPVQKRALMNCHIRPVVLNRHEILAIIIVFNLKVACTAK
jgi:hypothetical protein